ncbi:MAG: Lar family restriction alleviation protein [Terracidiphilus sp.]|jgi:Lar family restriction alleviation protein
MDKKDEFKPCPFCGSEVIHTRVAHTSGGWSTFIECSTCPVEMPSDNLGAARSRWNTRAYDPTVNRVVAHSKQVEWEKEQVLLQMEEIKRTYRIDLAAVKRDDRIAIAKYYEEELRKAQQRATMLEEALTTVRQTMEAE